MNDQMAILQFEEAKKILRGMRSNHGSQELKTDVTTIVGCRSDLYAETQELRQKNRENRRNSEGQWPKLEGGVEAAAGTRRGRTGDGGDTSDNRAIDGAQTLGLILRVYCYLGSMGLLLRI